jgi:putative DNA primase/helicase
MMDIRTVARALGGDVTGRNSVNAPGPGHSLGDRSMSVKIEPRAPDGFTVFSHSGDGWKVCRDYVRDRLGLEGWRPGKKCGTPRTSNSGKEFADEEFAAERKRWALKIWEQSVNPLGTLVERYLVEHRGLELPPELAGRAIRFHGSLKYDDFTRLPAMVCAMRNIVTGEITGIHRTFLDRATAAKVDRRMLGIARGTAIQLDEYPDDHITIAEGVETALSARFMGLSPVWALGSSGAVGFFPVLKGRVYITVCEERDSTSQKDVAKVKRRYLNAKRFVTIVRPRHGNDLNDSLGGMST